VKGPHSLDATDSSARTAGSRPQGPPRLPMRPGTRPIAARLALSNPGPVDTKAGAFACVATRAAADPDRAAVIDSGTTTTYGELGRRVRQWTARLRVFACGPGDRVGVAGPRCADTIAAFLAVESTGAAYVPLDPAWPTAWLTDVLERAALSCLIVLANEALPQAACLEVATKAGVPVVTSSMAGAAEPALTPVAALPPRPRQVAADEPRYIIHTSGSTGRPKGAIVTQLGLMNHLWFMIARLRLTASDTVAFTAPPCYVISVWQMVAVLLVGGTVAVVDDADRRFGRRLAARLLDARVTVLELVPTEVGWLADHLRSQARQSAPAVLPDLRWVVSTGEKLDPTLAESVRETLPQVELLNAYGATECSDDVCMSLVRPDDLARQRLAIGVPIANAVLYLLVPEQGQWRPADPGEAGELWVGGAPVGLGYLNDPELTSAAFFADEFDSDSPSGRIYRTGDLARFEGGVAYCLGRADRQVKIAGVRIELDEVEAAVARISGVSQCAIVVDEHDGEPALTAHYVGRPGLSKAELYALVRDSLPPGMVPRRWIRHDALPLNSSGKVDRRALRRLSTEDVRQ
jgi:D-alanine--poly(phosphoribitol) ligase subunit 1